MGQEIFRFRCREKNPSLGLNMERRSRRRASFSLLRESTSIQPWPGTTSSEAVARKAPRPRSHRTFPISACRRWNEDARHRARPAKRDRERWSSSGTRRRSLSTSHWWRSCTSAALNTTMPPNSRKGASGSGSSALPETASRTSAPERCQTFAPDARSSRLFPSSRDSTRMRLMPPWTRVITIRCKRLSPSRTRRGSPGTLPLADDADSARMTACSTMTVLFSGGADAPVVKEH